MPALVAGIHAVEAACGAKGVDGRDKPGQDVLHLAGLCFCSRSNYGLQHSATPAATGVAITATAAGASATCAATSRSGASRSAPHAPATCAAPAVTIASAAIATVAGIARREIAGAGRCGGTGRACPRGRSTRCRRCRAGGAGLHRRVIGAWLRHASLKGGCAEQQQRRHSDARRGTVGHLRLPFRQKRSTRGLRCCQASRASATRVSSSAPPPASKLRPS